MTPLRWRARVCWRLWRHWLGGRLSAHQLRRLMQCAAAEYESEP